MNSLPRESLRERVERTLERFPVVLLIGPRQCGKTTLAREIREAQDARYFDLEDPECPLRPESASLTLKALSGLVVIDEFQRMPQLFELLRVLADRRPLPARFLILGSASPDLVKGVSESLAGRIAYIPMGGFDLEEVGTGEWRKLWYRGRFPDSFLASDDAHSYEWRQNFIQSFLERDVPQLGIRVAAPTLRRFWTMVAHWHGQTWNASEVARALDARQASAKRYLDILTGAFMIRQLSPWFENIGKRLVKHPKTYFRDTGLLHALLGLRNEEQVYSHPRLGFSWEGFAIEEVLTRLQAERDAYFYKTHGGAELDLLLLRDGKKLGFEFKYQDSPRISKSMRAVMSDLSLEHLYVIYPGTERFPLDEKIEALPLSAINSVDAGED
jgi:predicted AAA+ superfamily ATPase